MPRTDFSASSKALDKKEEYFDFLDYLRGTGIVNMFGSAPYLAKFFGLDESEARKIVAEWMKTFEARHPETK